MLEVERTGRQRRFGSTRQVAAQSISPVEPPLRFGFGLDVRRNINL